VNQQLFADLTGNGRAILSDCGRYRYTLERAWAQIPRYVLWIMHNPSKADASIDDATVRRCRGFALSWGYTGILVANLYAYRSTDPFELWRQAAAKVDVIGPDNQRHVVGLLRRASLVICAWGQEGPVQSARFNVLQAIRETHTPHILRMNHNKFGHETEPSHPVRLSGKLQPTRWPIFDEPGAGHGA
jgi:hypothetical protein